MLQYIYNVIYLACEYCNMYLPYDLFNIWYIYPVIYVLYLRESVINIQEEGRVYRPPPHFLVDSIWINWGYITTQEALNLFKWRVRMAPAGKNFRAGQSSTVCPLCSTYLDNQAMAINCVKIHKKIVKTNIK